MVSTNKELTEQLTTPLEWGKAACDSLMAAYDASELPPDGRWHYHQGVFLESMRQLKEVIGGNEEYEQYIKAYVDHNIDENGNFLWNRKELDAIQAGLLLFELDRTTDDKRYKIAATKLKNMFPTLNRTSDGGFWHKDRYPYQMWLDGLYMGGVFAMNYAKAYDESELLDMVLEQERLMRKHTLDKNTGLYHHAWDESKKQPWADPETGKSPEFWGRAIGWYGITYNEILDFLPDGHSLEEELAGALRDLAASLVKYQDSETGLWYQVVDRLDEKDNWIETSCSALFIYTIARGIRGGYVDESYKEHAIKGYRGLLERMEFDENGLFTMPEICIGTGVGDYEHYINRPKTANDLHGVGSFVLASIEMQHLLPEL
ncbi:unsaturated rhamnogalacturonyl hydrolase YteR [Thalassobacillus devorans]|uniref:Unsaturated rhamnogalacturonyl hydrolase YteR n=1 Tax=Thalassobacillus devorans TaxID=279813 RepID=A0ABQ1NVK9_9BACI|nr:glycoside hydrolase family 88 protein [Thalassobacillus devorans]NIK28731.1 unsaturated rhamnogalacturonyl hydrolase [Thalassobacillus devorans]GGC83993.1 unsaturated rhamnogalacturonyl hydrolase YteR [Thalassobacillus devorans]